MSIATLVPMVIMIFWIGLYPASFLGKMEASVEKFISIYEKKYEAYKSQDYPNTIIADREVTWARK